MTANWNEELKQALIAKLGEKQGEALYQKYHVCFTHNYKDLTPVATTVNDIENIETLGELDPLEITLYSKNNLLHLRLFQWGNAIPLSDVLPMLENMDLRVISEVPFRINLNDKAIWISDFVVTHKNEKVDIDAIRPLFNDAFSLIYFGHIENDGFNKLVLGATLSWREIVILRAYAKYLRQIAFRFSQTYIEKALVAHTDISKNLVLLFLTMHDPNLKGDRKQSITDLETQILKSLDAVQSLDEDRILRRLFEVIKATLRTNYFQAGKSKPYKDYLSLKLNSRVILEMPLPTPLYETFVYSPHFEGIHLRNTKVARGGLRWSTRLEDFRTEILGLMKAQVVKNSVIVPSGAKGGFVLKTNWESHTKAEVQQEVITCYTAFVSGLLDITDNIVNAKIVPPHNVVCFDEPDTYLVVAADKGTATFSDIANSISAAYQFWLGDAFASGGSSGYDHKKMGITARGAWESIKRHFKELSIDITKHHFTAVGIGDMSGDVFGNGMIYTNKIALIAAFDHRDIFIDPNPNPERSFEERKRLFELPMSSWQNYNLELISPGGGVFSRKLKSITITAEMQQALGITESRLTPNELIRAILKAPVMLLYNGGIGTYVKSHLESNEDVADRSNDYTRVNGNELRCKVVGEGGNLGFTQLGRIEYALHGGMIYTDFIDNSGGVDCSDHEVNLKVLLYDEINKGKLDLAARDKLLFSLTDEVAELVLKDNYNQALILGYSAFRANPNIGLHIDYLRELEALGILNKDVEFLPSNKELVERKSAGLGLTRPELAILLAYTKIYLKQEILKTDIPEDPFLKQDISTAFPKHITEKYSDSLSEHKLAREIIATQISNRVVNEMGFTFVYRLQVETGATIDEIVRAHAVASRIYDTQKLQKLIEEFDTQISVAERYDMLYNIKNLINLTTRWFLHHPKILKENLSKLIEHYSTRISQLEQKVPDLMSGVTREYLNALTDKFHQAGLSTKTARHIATYRAIYTTLNIIEVATMKNFDLEKTAEVYFACGERVNLVWFRDQISHDSRSGHWNTLARLTLRDELDISQRSLTIAIMNKDEENKLSAPNLIEKWVALNKRALDRWERLLAMLHSSSNIEYTMFFIAIRELRALITTSY